MRRVLRVVVPAVAAAMVAFPSATAGAAAAPRSVPAQSASPGAGHTGGTCGQPYESGQHTVTVTSGGLQRVVVLYVPSTYDGSHRLPLVLTLHGSASNAVEQLVRSELP